MPEKEPLVPNNEEVARVNKKIKTSLRKAVASFHTEHTQTFFVNESGFSYFSATGPIYPSTKRYDPNEILKN